MAKLKFTFNLTLRGALVFVACLVGLIIFYAHEVEVSVRRDVAEFRQTLVNDCSRSEFLRLKVTRDDLSRADELVASIAACKTIKVKEITTANGGLILPVMVRLELSDEGHIPSGERVWYIATFRSDIFPFAVYYMFTDGWLIDPTVVSGGKMKYLYYLRV
ncbi:MAG: hypothetical protein HZB85_04940 [Deltaproteobacteria bacterium]|nr:hypothetical protein [Deltaproteobacteria bacterium]